MISDDLNELIKKLDGGITSLEKNGRILAQADRDYRVALRKEILLLREFKTPVSVISDLCRGKEDIAELRFKRDVAETIYNTNLEAINAWKLQIRILENQIGREWGRRDNQC